MSIVSSLFSRFEKEYNPPSFSLLHGHHMKLKQNQWREKKHSSILHILREYIRFTVLHSFSSNYLEISFTPGFETIFSVSTSLNISTFNFFNLFVFGFRLVARKKKLLMEKFPFP